MQFPKLHPTEIRFLLITFFFEVLKFIGRKHWLACNVWSRFMRNNPSKLHSNSSFVTCSTLSLLYKTLLMKLFNTNGEWATQVLRKFRTDSRLENNTFQQLGENWNLSYTALLFFLVHCILLQVSFAHICHISSERPLSVIFETTHFLVLKKNSIYLGCLSWKPKLSIFFCTFEI